MSIVDIYKDATKKLNAVVSQTPQRIRQLEELIKKAEQEEQDILHLAELESFNASQGYNIAKQIQKVRLKRRKYKDELDFLVEIRRVSNNNSKLDAHVSLLNNGIQKLTTEKKNRTYHVRVRTDLKGRIERASEKKKGGIDV